MGDQELVDQGAVTWAEVADAAADAEREERLAKIRQSITYKAPTEYLCGWEWDDGGRIAAGFKGTTGDCVTRAIAIATEMPYADVYVMINEEAKRERVNTKRKRGKRSSAREGVFSPTAKRLMVKLGWTWTPTMFIGSGCQVHVRRYELPTGRLVMSLSKHWSAMIDHVVHDLYDPARDGQRCVYGYWSKEN